MTETKYVNELGVFRCRVVRFFKKEAKGQSREAFYLETARVSDGATVSLRFSSPPSEKDAWRVYKALEALGYAFPKGPKPYDMVKAKVAGAMGALKNFVGTEVNVYVAPFVFNGKVMYSAQELISADYVAYGDKLASENDPLAAELGDFGGGFDTGSDPFGEPPPFSDADAPKTPADTLGW